MNQSILDPFFSTNGILILDGALATELEKRGRDLNHPLWSAKLLQDEPELIREVHLDYLHAGADCLITASYQATFQGFMAQGFTHEETTTLLQRSVDLAIEACDRFWADDTNHHGRQRPLVAASIGPYGAYLANGAEYTGDYDLDTAGLINFHRERWHFLANSGADLLACETIPSPTEMDALVALMQETDIPAWISFSCRDGRHISDGTPIATCAAKLADVSQVVAVGINCTAPKYLPELITAVRENCDQPIIIYPNSGEVYDPKRKTWFGTADPQGFGTAAQAWHNLGATVIGGCCRTGPEHIQVLADRFRGG